MSFHHQSLAWNLNLPSAACKLVLMGLASYANEDGECWPRQETLAEKTCQTSRSVRQHLAWLEEHGYISREHRSTTSGRRSDMYLLTLEATQPEKSSACATGKKRQTQPEKSSACSIHESVSKNIPDARDPAELIYQAYPRKVGKLHALKAVEKALKLTDFDTLMGAVKRFADKARSERTEERFIPHPATWFNAGRWMDGQGSAAAEPEPDYTDRKVWPNGNPANWPKHWIRHPTENRPMRPGEVP